MTRLKISLGLFSLWKRVISWYLFKNKYKNILCKYIKSLFVLFIMPMWIFNIRELQIRSCATKWCRWETESKDVTDSLDTPCILHCHHNISGSFTWINHYHYHFLFISQFIIIFFLSSISYEHFTSICHEFIETKLFITV